MPNTFCPFTFRSGTFTPRTLRATHGVVVIPGTGLVVGMLSKERPCSKKEAAHLQDEWGTAGPNAALQHEICRDQVIATSVRSKVWSGVIRPLGRVRPEKTARDHNG